MKGSFQDWLNVLERPMDENHTEGSNGPYTRSLLCGVIFSTVGMCWGLGFFSRFGQGEFFQAWVRLAGYILLSLLLFLFDFLLLRFLEFHIHINKFEVFLIGEKLL